MKHYIEVKGTKVEIEMGCNHPDYENKNCDGNCGECQFSIATMTIPDCMVLLDSLEYKKL